MSMASLLQLREGKELLERLASLEEQLAKKQNGIAMANMGAVERNKKYDKGAVVFNADEDIDFSWLLECVTPGTTGSIAVKISDDAKNGDTLTDGEVVWKLDDYIGAHRKG
jgi:hypothetical protein